MPSTRQARPHVSPLACLAALLLAGAPLAAHEEPVAWLEPSVPFLEPVPNAPSRAAASPTDDGGSDNLRTGALLSLDLRDYGHGNAKHDGLETEAAALFLELVNEHGTRFWLEVDADGEDSRHNLRELWIETILGDGSTWLRTGLQRFEQGSEAATRGEDFPLLGVGFPGWLDGRTDWGLRLDGYTDTDADVWWALGFQGGAGFGKNGRQRRGQAVSARLVFTPDPDPDAAFRGPFLGVAVTRAFDVDDPLEIANPLEQTVLSTPRLDGRSATYVHLEGGWRTETLRLGAETVRGEVADVALPGVGRDDVDQLGSWSAWFSVMLSGRAPVWWRGRYHPHPLTSGSTQYGERPVELAFRYSNADIDRTLFDTGVTNYSQSTQEVRTFSAALSSQLTPDTRLALQWTKTIADHELTTFGGRNRDSSWALRWDERFGRAGR